MRYFLGVVAVLLGLSGAAQSIVGPENRASDWGSFTADSGVFVQSGFLDAQLRSRVSSNLVLGSQMPFGFKELHQFNGGILVKNRQDFIGIRFDFFGTSQLQSQHLKLFYSKALGAAALGAAFTVDGIKAVEKKAVPSIGADLSFVWTASNQFHWGFQVEKLVYSNRSFQQPIIKLGAGWQFSEFVWGELRLVSSDHARAFFEICYRPQVQWMLRFGFKYPEIGYWYALSWRLKRLSLEQQLSYQPLLGFTPGLRLLFQLKSN